MHLLLHQVSWPAILNLKSVGTGPNSRPILLPFRGNFFCFSSGVFKILESDLFQDNFVFDGTLFLWRGKWPVRCHVMGCARNRNASFNLSSCDSDMHDCMVKAQVEVFRCVRGRRGRTGDAKATGDSEDQLGIMYALKWFLSQFTGLFCLKKDCNDI